MTDRWHHMSLLSLAICHNQKTKGISFLNFNLQAGYSMTIVTYSSAIYLWGASLLIFARESFANGVFRWESLPAPMFDFSLYVCMIFHWLHWLHWLALITNLCLWSFRKVLTSRNPFSHPVSKSRKKSCSIWSLEKWRSCTAETHSKHHSKTDDSKTLSHKTTHYEQLTEEAIQSLLKNNVDA